MAHPPTSITPHTHPHTHPYTHTKLIKAPQRLACFFLGLLAFSSVVGCTPPAPVDLGLAIELNAQEKSRLASLSPLPAPPASPSNRYADDPKAAHFGQFLFFDKRLSAEKKFSCSSCHDPNKGWGDGLPTAKTIAEGSRNAPTIWNVAYNRWFFWDGRTDTLWAQATQPFENPIEMGATRVGLLHLFNQEKDLKQAYETLFGPLPDASDTQRFPEQARPVADDPNHVHQKAWEAMSPQDQEVTNRFYTNIAKAIAAFERKIISKDSPFDTFVSGLQKEDPQLVKSLDASAQRGLKIFIGQGNCTFCHFGKNLSNSEFHNIGLNLKAGSLPDVGRFPAIEKVLKDPFNALGNFSDDNAPEKYPKLTYLTDNEAVLGAFKTPTLREIANTAPYMHDGRFATLDEVLDFYNELPGKPPIGHREESLFPLKLTAEQKTDLIAFLRSLSSPPLPTNLTQSPATPLP
ncbi:MAG: cytochrome-c peroxidase [Myxococcales bacterium]|nr:cytochrome-c peroxidase [Myxococcales bacterium]